MKKTNKTTKKIYVMAFKSNGDMPSLWIELKDTNWFLTSKTIKKIQKLLLK